MIVLTTSSSKMRMLEGRGKLTSFRKDRPKGQAGRRYFVEINNRPRCWVYPTFCYIQSRTPWVLLTYFDWYVCSSWWSKRIAIYSWHGRYIWLHYNSLCSVLFHVVLNIYEKMSLGQLRHRPLLHEQKNTKVTLYSRCPLAGWRIRKYWSILAVLMSGYG